MTNTPLNPDALANLRLLADRATEEVRHAVIEPDVLHKLLDHLAAAQPVVNSVEELDALPLGTIIEDSDDDCVLQALERGSIMGTEWYIPGIEKIFTSKDVELPARVLYRPEVKP